MIEGVYLWKNPTRVRNFDVAFLYTYIRTIYCVKNVMVRCGLDACGKRKWMDFHFFVIVY